jgi:RNA polymerase sigma factor for flagellar operon FliA
LDLPLKKIQKARIAGDIYSVMPIEEQLEVFDNINKKIEEEELIEIIKKELSKMDKREQMIIQLYYFEELSLKEISEILGISESRISQIHKAVIRRIRESLNG